MPIYEYVCDGCQQRFERYVRAWGESVSCPRCGGRSLEKQLSRFALASGAATRTDGAADATARACCGGSCGCAH